MVNLFGCCASGRRRPPGNIPSFSRLREEAQNDEAHPTPPLVLIAFVFPALARSMPHIELAALLPSHPASSPLSANPLARASPASRDAPRAGTQCLIVEMGSVTINRQL